MTVAASGRGIVVGVDGSPSSEAAIAWAAHTAELHNRPLTLVYVVPSPVVATGPWPQIPVPEMSSILEESGERILTEARAIVSGTSADRVRVGAELARSSAVTALTEFSEDADMVVVGSSGRTALGRMLLGSVSTGLVHHAHCPVAVVRADEQPKPQAPVLVGIDGSPASELATDIAFAEASARQVELVALHGWRDESLLEFPGLDVAALQQQAEETLAERLAGQRERYPDVRVRREVVSEHPTRALAKHAESAQLVVLGSHGRGGFVGMLLGSVSTAIVHAVRTPVIVARQT